MEMTSEEARLRTGTLPDVSTATNVEGDRGLVLHSNGRESKVKFLCSYGGKIMPRPSDQKLRYVGGETRVISIPQDLDFDGLKLLLGQTYGLELTLKYQLPGEELDALVSVSSEEDFKNMMEEYDRLDGLEDSSRRRIFVFSSLDNPNPIDLIENTDPKVVEKCFVEAVNDISMKKMDNAITMNSMRRPSPFPSCSVADDSQLHGAAVVEGNDSEHHDGRYIPRNADAFLHAKGLEPNDLISSSTSPCQLVPISEFQTHVESRQIKTNMDLLDGRLIGETQVQQMQGKDSQNNSLSPGAKLQDETVELEVTPETAMSNINTDVNLMADREYFVYFPRETPEQDARTPNVVDLSSANDQISTGQSLSTEACVYSPLMVEKIEERYFSREIPEQDARIPDDPNVVEISTGQSLSTEACVYSPLTVEGIEERYFSRETPEQDARIPDAPNVVEISTGQSLSIEALCSPLMVEGIEERDFSLQTRRDAVIEPLAQDLQLEDTFDTAYGILRTFTNYKMQAPENLQIIPNNDLEDLKEIGSGTFGIVYYGKWKGTDVAIKRIKSDCFKGNLTEQKRSIEDFWREASILGQLHHPNVLAFYGVVTDGPENSLATVTEYMVDGSLRQALSRNHRKFDHRKRLLIAMDIAFGMEYLHGKKVVHFDLKSGNLLVNLRDPQRPVCKIGDLGMSKVKQQTWTTGGVRGTLPWMAPELLNGISNLVSDKVDVFSFGIVLWELLTGEEPYANMHYGAIIGGIVSNTLRPPIPESCDNAWRSLMEACWSVDATERPAFSEIARTLQEMEATISATERQEANTN